MRMHPKPQGIHALRLNRSSKLWSLFKLIISESVSLFVARSLRNTLLLFTRVLSLRMHPKLQGIHALTLESFVQALEFVQTNYSEFRATLGRSFISKHVVIVYTGS